MIYEDKGCVFIKSGRHKYALKLTANDAVWLEKKMGCPVLEGFCRIEEMRILLLFTEAMLRKKIKYRAHKKAVNIYDAFIGSGGSLYGFAEMIYKTLINYGFIKPEIPDWKTGKEYMKIFQEIHNNNIKKRKGNVRN